MSDNGVELGSRMALKRPMCLKFAVWPTCYWKMVETYGVGPRGRLQTTAGFTSGTLCNPGCFLFLSFVHGLSSFLSLHTPAACCGLPQAQSNRDNFLQTESHQTDMTSFCFYKSIYLKYLLQYQKVNVEGMSRGQRSHSGIVKEARAETHCRCLVTEKSMGPCLSGRDGQTYTLPGHHLGLTLCQMISSRSSKFSELEAPGEASINMCLP